VDTAGLVFYDHQLAGGLTPTQVAALALAPTALKAGRTNSPVPASAVAAEVFAGAESQQDLVTGFYQRFLQRAPDAAGLSAYTGQLQQGANDEQVIAQLVGSPEFFAAQPPPS
jgi:hypothetical protein